MKELRDSITSLIQGCCRASSGDKRFKGFHLQNTSNLFISLLYSEVEEKFFKNTLKGERQEEEGKQNGLDDI